MAQSFALLRGELYASDALLLQYSVDDGQKKTDMDYEDVKPVLLIFLLRNSPAVFADFQSPHYIHRFGEYISDTGLSFMPLCTTVYVQLDKCLEQFKAGKDGENDSDLQLMLAAIADINNEVIQEKAKENRSLQEIYAEVWQFSQSKEVQGMLLSEFHYSSEKSGNSVKYQKLM